MSRESVIIFDHVSMAYTLNAWFQGGLKNALVSRGLWGRRQRPANRVLALHDVSFTVNRGENFAIIGHNGSGKSTTLGLIAGVLRPTQGCVSVRGRVSPLLELGAGFHPELSGRDNIILNGILLGMRRPVVLAKLDEIIEFSGLGSFIEHPLRTYSSGMLARLGFAVVVHLDPDILLIDEILAVGDAEFALKCVAVMEKFKHSETTVVLVSHDLSSIQRLCDRAALIEHGQLRFVGPTDDTLCVYTQRMTTPQVLDK